jgi:tetratricopeptide (TPR) repeat protein
MSERSRNFRILKEGYRTFKKKQYANASVILEKSIQSFPNNPYPVFLLAVTKLYSADLAGANTAMEKLQRVDPSYIPFLQLRAFMGLKSATGREQAIAFYLDALEKAPRDKMLLKGLRQCEDLNNFAAFQKNSRITDLVDVKGPGIVTLPDVVARYARKKSPSPKRRAGGIKWGRIPVIFFLFIAAAITGLYLAGVRVPGGIKDESVAIDPKDAAKIDMVDISGSGYGLFDRISRQPAKEFYTSADVMIAEFNEARKLMKQGRFNSAVVILNRIINSNASQVVKEKCEFLVKFIIDSDDRVYEKPDLKAMRQKPWLYRGAAFELEGKTANVKRFGNSTGFTLMVDYDGENFKWIAQVFSPEKDAAVNGDNVKVQGVYIYGIGGEGNAYISSARVEVIK